MKKVHLLLFALILVLAGCSSNSENMITHIPYQVEKDGRWGLIDWEGNPLVEEEFKHRPSVVIDGMFCVKNSDDMYEIYTAEKKPKQIGEEYLSVGPFANGLAPVVKKDSRIIYINKEGKVIIELTKYNDDPIVKAWPFDNGIAIIATASGKVGCINTKGEFVVPPIYVNITHAGDNILCILNDKYKVGYIDYKGKTLVEPQYSYGSSFDKKGYALVALDEKDILIDKTGKELFKLKDDMKIIGDCSDENLIPYCLDDDSYGYLNLKGEKAIKLSSNIKKPTSFLNGYAIFKNSDGDYGTINTKGEVVIRAKYDELRMSDGFDFILFEDDNEWGLLSFSGDVIKRASYKYILPFQKGNKYTYAIDGDEWILIDQKGEDTKIVNVENIDYGDYSYNQGYSYIIESDYLDIDAEVKNIMSILNQDGTIDKMTFDMTPEIFANVYNKYYKVNDLQGSNIVNTYIPTLEYAEREIGILYNEEVLKANYKQKWVSTSVGGYYTNVLDGYSYNNNTTQKELRYFCELKGKLANRQEEVLEAVWKYLENNNYINIGRWKPEGTNYEVTNYEKNNHTLQIALKNDGVLRIWTWRK